MKNFAIVLVFMYMFSFAQEIGARYLIITHDDFYDAIQPLAQWKHRKGMRTKLAKLSETGASAAAIKSYIQTAYNTWQIPPEFLLLVGAPNYLPFPYVGGTSSDNYYTNMDSDIYNEILSGRLTVHNTTEAQTVVNRILLYEKTPDTSDSSWFINACLIVNEDGVSWDDSIYWSDINHAKNLMLNGGYNIIDTLSDFAGDNADDVIQAANNGRAIVLYRGCGVNNWFVPFNVNPDLTENGTKLPIVLSITSRTIGTSSTPAVAEKWLLTGEPSFPRGGAGYFATTTLKGTTELRSAVCKGFFNAVFQNEKRTLGEACEGGRKNVYDLYSSVSEYCGFTTLGDPEMNIWTAIPRPLDVFHDSTLSVIDDSLIVDVLSDSMPVESALVCAVLDTVVYEYGYTSNMGNITLHFDTLHQGSMDITVTAHNKIPYLDSIPVLSTDVGEEPSLKTIEHASISITPNPFRNGTRIVYTSPQKSERMIIEIFAVDGRRVMKFTPRESSGIIMWQGDDDRGQSLAAGVYFVELETDNNTHTKKVILLD